MMGLAHALTPGSNDCCRFAMDSCGSKTLQNPSVKIPIALVNGEAYFLTS